MISPYDDLNPAQQKAVLHPSGPLLILAGAGSGKTRVITYRLAELVRRGADPRRILAVTFTNKAAGEMRERASKLLGGALSGMWIGTFHATCARLLRMHAASAGLPRDFVIFDEADQMSVCAQVLKELDLSEHLSTPRVVLSAIDQAKNRGLGPKDPLGNDYFTDMLRRAYPLYQQRLRESGAVDFGDLLLLPLQLCESDPAVARDLGGRFDHVLVDEFQDTNRVQYRLLCRLAEKSRQLIVVGDDDQAIYGWRGADVRNLLDFERDWPDATLVKLEQNYRSTQIILTAANAVIARNPERRGKQLFTDRQGGEPILYHTAQDERREADFVVTTIRRLMQEEGRSPADFAVCYRTNAQSRALEESLRSQDLPYAVIGGMRFYDRAEVKDVLAYLRLCLNPADEVALRRVINVPSRGIGDATIARLEAHKKAAAATGATVDGTTLWQALLDLLRSKDEALGTGPRKKLVAFVHLIDELRQLQKQAPLDRLAEAVVERTGYLERLSNDDGPESAARRENVMELIGSIHERTADAERRGEQLGLIDYLEQISLASSTDATAQGVSLMTVHAAKGLEFPVVIVTGLEDGLFPSLRRMEEHGEYADPIAEERRLAYVAITRARERLVLTNAQRRRLYGQAPRPAEPSRFLREIPASCIQESYQPLEDGDDEPAGTFSPRRTWHKHPAHEPGEVYYEREDQPTPAPGRRPRPSGGSEGEYHIEYDDAAIMEQGAFELGQKVRHPTYGQGEVRAFSGHGKDLKLVVYFPVVGSKTVIARFLTPC